MTLLNPPPRIEQRVILRDVSWELYEHLLAEYEGVSNPRFAYDQGALEIMVLSPEHERFKQSIATLVELLAGELEMDLDGVGSTTFRREDFGKGFEPDASFYVQHAEEMRRKKRIDLALDPPPDLVIEIDITNSSLNKFPILASLGALEVWRYDGARLTIYQLENRQYQEREESLALPRVTSEALTHIIAESQTMKRADWLKTVRAWAQTLLP